MSFVKKGGRLRPREPITRALTSNNVRIAFILPKFLGLHFTNFSLTLEGQPLVSLDLPPSLAHSSAFLGGSVGGASTLQRVCREPGLQAASDCRLFAGGGGGTPWDWSKMAEFYLPPPVTVRLPPTGAHLSSREPATTCQRISTVTTWLKTAEAIPNSPCLQLFLLQVE